MNAVQPSSPDSAPAFADLGLSDAVMQALAEIGYESPSPIQAATIPALLRGVDILGQAQTGTGKTAAFALPILSRIEIDSRDPQALVMVPTRELAIQVAEAFQKYAARLKGFHVMPIYGGQSYTPQLNALKRGTHVIVGTPGRIKDHIDRGTLQLKGLRFVVLDEADEMLQMGFVDAIEEILSLTPPNRQTALFSATMAPAIRRIAQKHLRSPQEITIRGKTTTAANIRQRFWPVSGMHKLDALTRILEVEPFDAMLVFARTKQSTVELAERLEARGFAAAALNGDIQQSQRERTVAALKGGKIDILVATDVAARGLDVERISHVVNFDVPYDTESYVHRIGRTGRAGRSGEAILFIAPRERNMLRLIERATRQPIEQMSLPSIDDVNSKRVAKFKTRISEALAGGTKDAYRNLVEEFALESGVDMTAVAAALATLVHGKTPLFLSHKAAEAPNDHRQPASRQKNTPPHKTAAHRLAAQDQDTYRLQVGRTHGAQAGNIVGAIANEAGLDGSDINGIDIQDDHSFVRLPAGMPPAILKRLQKVRVKGQMLMMTRVEARHTRGHAAEERPTRSSAGRERPRRDRS